MDKIMFTIGDKVVSKKLGVPGVGIVYGIAHSSLVISKRGVSEYWSNLYPEWVSKSIIFVSYNEPIYIQSFNEFITSYKILPNVPKKILKDLYKYSSKAKILSYPIDDLEMFEKKDEVCSSNM